jgi:glycosyltransferase involved in cell wall biosynthesis
MVELRVLACAFACCPPEKPGFSGGEDVLGWQLLQQIARSHQVWALTQAEDRVDIEQALSEHPIPNLRFFYVDLPRWLRPLLSIQGGHQFYYYLWQIRAYFAARGLQKRHRFQLFHHITYANDWMVSFIGAFLPIPYVRGPGGGSHRTPKGLEREYTFGGRVWERIRAIGQWLLRRDPFFTLGQRRAAAILVCNPEAVAAVPGSWSGKVHLYPVTGISSTDLAQNLAGNSNGIPFRVLSAGSLVRIKGFSLAIKAFKQFADLYPDSEFNIIGSGPEESRLRGLIHSSNLDTKVHLLGQMPRGELLSRMSFHDVFLFPSLRDGGGAVVIEAMAAGKPVVCLDAGGPGMHVSDEWGFKITPTTPKDAVNELASALERLYLDPDLRQRMGRAARKRSKNFYHWDKLGDQLMKIYHGAIDAGRDV